MVRRLEHHAVFLESVRAPQICKIRKPFDRIRIFRIQNAGLAARNAAGRIFGVDGIQRSIVIFQQIALLQRFRHKVSVHALIPFPAVFHRQFEMVPQAEQQLHVVVLEKLLQRLRIREAWIWKAVIPAFCRCRIVPHTEACGRAFERLPVARPEAGADDAPC